MSLGEQWILVEFGLIGAVILGFCVAPALWSLWMSLLEFLLLDLPERIRSRIERWRMRRMVKFPHPPEFDPLFDDEHDFF